MPRVNNPFKINPGIPRQQLPRKKPLSVRHPRLFQILTTPLWLLMGTAGTPGGPKIPAVSGEIIIPGTTPVAAPAAPTPAPAAPATPPAPAQAPPPQVTVKTYDIDTHNRKLAANNANIEKFNKPKWILSKRPIITSLKATLTYGLPVAFLAALATSNVFLSVGALFPFLLGKGTLGILTTLIGSNALLGGLIGGAIHLIATRIIKSRAKKGLNNQIEDSRDMRILAEALYPYCRPIVLETGEKILDTLFAAKKGDLNLLFDQIAAEKDAEAAAAAALERLAGGTPPPPPPLPPPLPPGGGYGGGLPPVGDRLPRDVQRLLLDQADYQANHQGLKSALGNRIKLTETLTLNLIEADRDNVEQEIERLKGVIPTLQDQLGLRLTTKEADGSERVFVVELAEIEKATQEIKQEIKHGLLIGAGAMGEVYKAREEGIENKFVAIKVVKKDQEAMQADLRARIESRIQGISHENLIVVHGFGKTKEGRPFLAMEFIEGNDLDIEMAHIQSLGHDISPKMAIEWVRQIAEGVKEVHDNQIYHRDLKPQNIFCVRTKDGRTGKESYLLIVADFGLAKILHEDIPQAEREATREGALPGTLTYLPPESSFLVDIKGSLVPEIYGEWLARTDVFAIGCILYRLATFENALEFVNELDFYNYNFNGPTTEQRSAIQAHGNQRAKEILAQKMAAHNMDNHKIKRPEGIEDWLWTIIEKATAFNPLDRYQNPDELLADINALRFNGSGSGRRTPKPTPAKTQDSGIAHDKTAISGEGVKPVPLPGQPLPPPEAAPPPPPPRVGAPTKVTRPPIDQVHPSVAELETALASGKADVIEEGCNAFLFSKTEPTFRDAAHQKDVRVKLSVAVGQHPELVDDIQEVLTAITKLDEQG